MKRFVLSLCVLCAMAATNHLLAQCAIKNSSFNIQNTQSAGGGCQVTFDFAFEFNNNGGNKIVVIQAWKQGNYPNYWQCANGSSKINKGPNKTDLEAGGAAPFLNIAFDMSTSPATILTTYGPDNSVPLQTGYAVMADPATRDAQGYFTVTVTGMTVTVPNQSCGGAITILSDVWSSQSNLNSPWSAHCVVCGNNFAFNYPLVEARIVDCNLPRQYEVSINNINTNQTIVSTWKTYINNGPLTLGDEDVLVDQQTTGVTIAPQTPYTSPTRTWTGSDAPPGSNATLLVEVTTQGLANTQLADAFNPCSPLPVAMRTFTALRSKEKVQLKWETAAEQNNRGFYVQRNVKGVWENRAFVFSAADDGNSSDLLAYAFNDVNTEKGVSQYRIQQVDLDGRATYSVIRAVRGEGQATKAVVYPNPSGDGRVNVVFDTQGAKSVTVSDLSGRVVRRYPSAVNSLQIEGLESGLYSIQITDLSSRASAVEKVIIKKR